MIDPTEEAIKYIAEEMRKEVDRSILEDLLGKPVTIEDVEKMDINYAYDQAMKVLTNPEQIK